MKKYLLLSLSLLASIHLMAATFYPSRTDFRDEQIYFLLPTRFYDGDPTNNTQCWDNQSRRTPAIRHGAVTSRD